jgi:hypothetical protein
MALPVFVLSQTDPEYQNGEKPPETQNYGDSG